MDNINLTEDSQQEKAKGAYEFWHVRETTMLIRLLILPILNATLGCQKTHKHYLSRLKSLKKLYNSMQELTRYSFGFGWDPISKNFTAPSQVWDDYEKAHPSKKSMRDETFEDYEDLQLIFEQGLATGKMLLILDLLDIRRKKDLKHQGFRIQLCQDAQKAHQRRYLLRRELKVSKVENLVTQTWMNNIWEAIKEISGLEEDVKYDTLKELHKWGMKDVFINMSIEERMGWIIRNVK
ncbi:hypothetical protein N665_0167s0024 [Sinapis alba]|nr:hypothetical protein N665_0167s0024 [Sinapis alba]